MGIFLTSRDSVINQLINELDHHFFIYLNATLFQLLPPPHRQKKNAKFTLEKCGVRDSDMPQSPACGSGITLGPLSSQDGAATQQQTTDTTPSPTGDRLPNAQRQVSAPRSGLSACAWNNRLLSSQTHT